MMRSLFCERHLCVFYGKLLIVFVFIFFAAPASAATDSLRNFQKILLGQKKTDSASFYTFAGRCLEKGDGNILMSTYRQLVESGQKDMVSNDLVFLRALNSKVDTNKLNENNFYVCYYLNRIVTKYHSDSLLPLQYAEQALAIAVKLNDVCLTAKAYFSVGSYYMNIKHDLLKASESHDQLNDILKKNHKNGIIDCNVDENIGYSVLYYYLEDFAAGLEYINKSIASVKLIKKPLRLFDLYCRRSFYEGELGHNDKALATLDTARMVAKELPNSADLYNYLSADTFNIYIKTGDYERALPLSKRVVLARLDGANDEYYDYLISLVKLNIHFGEYPIAEKNTDLYISTLKPWNIQRWKNAYEMKYTLSKAEHKPAEALKYFEAYTLYNDSVHHQRQNFAVIAQQIKYQTRQKEEALKLQIAANLVQEQRSNFIIAVTIAICLLLLLVLVYRTNTGLREKERLSKSFAVKLLQNTEKEQHRLANELHDGLGQELLLLKNSLIQDADNVKAAQVGDIIENVRGMARELYPSLLEVVGLQAAIANRLQKIDEQESIFVSAEIDYNGTLDKHTQLQVYRIFQEAMTNVLKYARATSVLVKLQEENGTVTLTVKDNGAGFDTEAQQRGLTGFGLQSIRQRADSINGVLKIAAEKNKGTEITLTFNVHENTHS